MPSTTQGIQLKAPSPLRVSPVYHYLLKEPEASTCPFYVSELRVAGGSLRRLSYHQSWLGGIVNWGYTVP